MRVTFLSLLIMICSQFLSINSYSRSCEDFLNYDNLKGIYLRSNRVQKNKIISSWIEIHAEDENPIPSSYSKNPYEKFLGKNFANLRYRYPKSWYWNFSGFALEIINKAERFEVRKLFTTEERLEQFSIWVLNHQLKKIPYHAEDPKFNLKLNWRFGLILLKQEMRIG